MLLALLVLIGAAQPRPFAEERQLLDRRLETLRRILPNGPTADADGALVRQLAEEAQLSTVEVRARPPVAHKDHGDLALEVSALGRYLDIDRFFRQVALSHRIIDVESLALSATGHDAIGVTAVLHLPHHLASRPLPVPPDEARVLAQGLPRSTARDFLRDQALALAKAETVVRLRRSQRNPRLFLSEVAAVVRERPVTLAYASLDDAFVIRGQTVGEGPVRALETRFERGFLRVSEFLVVRDGACRRFEVRGVSPVAGVEAELPLPVEDPFVQDEAPCQVDRDAGKTLAVRGPSHKGKAGGPLTLRLRDVDLADTFQVLHLLTSQTFVVDGDVAARVSLDFAQVTLEEALSPLRGAGFVIAAAGPAWRVSKVDQRPPAQGSSAGKEPLRASFSLKRAPVREILAVMTEADPSLGAIGPEGFLGRVSLWASQAPIGLLRSLVLEAADLAERLEDGRRILDRVPRTDETLLPVGGTPRDRRLETGPQDLAALEFDLAGLAANGSSWMALAYSPKGVLHTFRQGDRLADGSVRMVSAGDVVLDTDSGPLRIPLRPLPR